MTKKLSAREITQLIASQCNIDRKIMWILVDREYETISIDKLHKIIRKDQVNETRYVSEKFDCDDFSLLLAGRLARYSAGMIHVVYTGKDDVDQHHALNWAITDDKKVYYIEPQTDRIFEPTDDYIINFIYG